MASWSFHSAGTLHVGRGALARLPEIVAPMKAARLFLVTDNTLKKIGIVKAFLKAIPGVDVEVFSKITPEPPEATIVTAIAAAKKYRPSAIVGLGGGSNMDAAKLVAVCLMHGGKPSDFTGDSRVPGPVTPLICIPTTAGTGSEVSPAAVFTDAKNKIKVSCLSPFIRPAAAVVDPSLTDGCPRQVTADSGIDALTHAIEAYAAVDHETFVERAPTVRSIYQGKNPCSDAVAEECIRLVARFLKRAVQDGTDMEARDGMAAAATLGGLAFSNAGVALVHAMEYPVGGAVHVSHGAGNGLLLPHVMRFNSKVNSRVFDRIGELLGVKRHVSAAIAAVEDLARATGIPQRLRDLGVKRTQLPEFADRAYAIKRLMRVNHRTPSRDDILGIYEAAW